jgi:hypothetical protein
MATATKVRKTKDGSGTIYKLEPALVVESAEVEYVIYSHIPRREPFEGFLVLPATTLLVACVPSGDVFKRKSAIFTRSFEMTKLSAEKALGLIGYTVK